MPPIPSIGFPGIVSASFPAYANNTLYGLWRGWRFVGGSVLFTPTAFNTIGAPISNGHGRVTVSANDTWATKGKSWRGVTRPHGAFAKEQGTHYRTAVAITSYTAFTFAEVTVSATYAEAVNTDGSPIVISYPLGGPLGVGLYQSFGSDRLRGISWGRDGRPGGGDDIVYDVKNPGSYTTRVNELLFVGQGEWGFTSPPVPPDPPKSDAEQFADYLDLLAGFHPYTFTHTYRLRSVSSTVTVTVNPTRRGTHPPLPHRPLRPFRPFMDR